MWLMTKSNFGRCTKVVICMSAVASWGGIPVRRGAAVREGAVRRAGRRRRPAQRLRNHRIHQGPHLRQRDGVSRRQLFIRSGPAGAVARAPCQLINRVWQSPLLRVCRIKFARTPAHAQIGLAKSAGKWARSGGPGLLRLVSARH